MARGQFKDFLHQYVFNFKKTGAIKGSSHNLALKFVQTANLQEARSVVELGSGNGVVTEKIMQHLSPETLFFALEINTSFVKKTKTRCPEATIYEDSAENLANYLNQYNLTGFDCIISGLPWSLFNENMQEKLVQIIYDCLNPGGEFLTFAYIQGSIMQSGKRFRNSVEEKFNHLYKTKIVWKNTPPAFVYRAVK